MVSIAPGIKETLLKICITAIPFIIALLGAFFLWFGLYEAKEANLQEFAKASGKAMIAGGVFAVLVKYMQFMEIFKNELLKIIYGTEYLEKRKDLPDIWVRVSKVLFNNKFPQISNEITDDVKRMYFPTDHVLYYKDYEQLIEVELLDKKTEKVKVTQTSRYTVYPKDDADLFSHESKNTLHFKERSEVSFKIIKYTVDGTDVVPNIKEEVIDNSLVTNYSVDIMDKKKEYKFHTVAEKTYSLKSDCVMGQWKKFIIQNLNVKVHLIGDLSLEFYNIGTIRPFINKSSFIDKNYKEYEYKGLIYPRQGYLFFIKCF